MALLYVANWKMQKTFNESIEWFKKYADNFNEIAFLDVIVICPTFLEIFEIAKIIKKISDKHLFIGAQSCSVFDSGAYTGEISAKSLKEVGCSYSIVGHSERRTLFNESVEDVSLKVKNLLSVGIKPIICVGESKQQMENGLVKSVLEKQLIPILKETRKFEKPSFCIAYEPVWAIGTGETPNIKVIEKVFKEILKICKQHVPVANISLLYGGSVSSTNAKIFKNIDLLSGFLIGGASLDFQEFKKIVL